MRLGSGLGGGRGVFSGMCVGWVGEAGKVVDVCEGRGGVVCGIGI